MGIRNRICWGVFGLVFSFESLLFSESLKGKMCNLKLSVFFIALSVTLSCLEATPIERWVTNIRVYFFLGKRVLRLLHELLLPSFLKSYKNRGIQAGYFIVVQRLLSVADDLSDGTSKRQGWMLPVMSQNTLSGLSEEMPEQPAAKTKRYWFFLFLPVISDWIMRQTLFQWYPAT